MATRGKITELFDLENIEAQKAKVIAIVEEFVRKTGEAKPIRLKLEGAEKTKDVITGINQMGAAMKENVRITNQAAAAQEKLTALESEQAKKLAETKVAIQAKNKELTTEAKLNSDAISAYDKFALTLENLKKQYKDLVVTGEQNTDAGKALKTQIDALQKTFENANKSVKDFRFNVGNYNESAQIIVDALSHAQAKFDGLNKSADASPAAIKAAGRELDALKRITDNPQFMNVAFKFGDTKAEVGQLREQLLELKQSGVDPNSDSVNLLKGRLAELTREIKDTRAEIKAMSSDTRAFDLFASSVKSLVSIYEVGVGVTELFGHKNEDVEKSIKKLVAVQALANGVREIANQLTEKGTAANKLYAFAQKQISIATDAAEKSTTRLNAVLKLTAFGLIASAIGYLIINFDSLISSLDGTATKLKELQKIADEFERDVKNLEQFNTLLKQSNDEIVASLEAGFAQEKEIRAQRLAAQKEELKAQIELENQYKESGEAARKYLQQVATGARGYVEENVEANKKVLENYESAKKKRIELASQVRISEARNVKENTLDAVKASQAQIDIIKLELQTRLNLQQSIADNDRNSFADRIQAVKRAGQLRQQIIEEDAKRQLATPGQTPEQIALIEKQRAAALIDAKKATQKQLLALEIESAERLRAARLSILKSEQEQAIQNNQVIIDAEKSSFDQRTAALYDNYERRRSIIIAQYQNELKNTKLTAEERIAIEKKYANDINALTIEYGAQQLAIYKGNQAAITEAIEKEQQRRLDVISKNEAQAQFQLNEELLKGLVSYREFNKKRAEIERNAQIERLKEEINALTARKIILISQRKEQSAEYADIEKQEKEKSLELQKVANFERLAAEEEMFERRKQLAQEAVDFLFSIFTGQIDREKNEIQDQINALDQKKEKDIEVASASIANEQERAAAIANINAKAAAQKEALERRQRQLDLERARFEKAANIAKIISDTARAVVAALTSTPPNVPLSVLVGTIGALQLAKAIAAPLPKFAEGTEDSPGGLNIVGDGRKKELVVEPSGKTYTTPAKSTVMNIPKHSIIFPDADQALEDLKFAAMRSMARMLSYPIDEKQYGQLMTQAIENKLDKIDRTIRNKKELHIRPGFNSVMALHKYGNSWNRYVDDQTNF